MLEFNIRNQEISRIDNFSPAEKSVEYLIAKFNFKTEDWSEATKRAIFRNVKSKVEKDTMLEDDFCIVPWEVLVGSSDIEVSVHGVIGTEEITTNVVVFNLSRTLQGGSATQEPSPTVYEQMTEMVKETKEIAQSVRTDADNGKFNGPQGPVGKDGKSAYEIAVAHGFEGSEEEWLESLQGENDGKDNSDATVTTNSITDALGYMPVSQEYVDEQIAKAQLEGAGVDTSNFVLQSDLENLKVGGLTSTEKNLILTLFKNVKYSSDVSTEYAQLETLFTCTTTMYTITNTLVHVTNNNGATSGEENSSYTATLTASEGYDLSVGTVTVFMGGSDVTSSVYDTDTFTITISKLTGDVAINAEAIEIVQNTALYELNEPTTFDGSTSIDTGYTLDLTNSSWAIAVEFTTDGANQTNSRCVFSTHGNNFAQSLKILQTWDWAVSPCGSNIATVSSKNGIDGIKYILTHNAGDTFLTAYYLENGVVTSVSSEDNSSYWINANNKPCTMKLGSSYTGDSNYFVGTINQFKIYGRVITSNEINTFMGV